MKNKHIKELVEMTNEAVVVLKRAAVKFNLSARSYYRLIKVSRTIADLDQSLAIYDKHINEAVQYRLKNE